MGHLIDSVGGSAIVDFVAANHNLARVHDLAAVPAFMAWLAANGLTVDEAALIQPAYCEAPADCTCSEIQGKSYAVGTVSNATTGSGGAGAGGSGGGASGGLVLHVTDVYGNAGIEVGDELALPSWVELEVGDQIIADLGTFGTMLGNPRLITDGEVAMSACGLQTSPPGPLPVDVFVDAALSANHGACASTLGAHDPAWVQSTGDACGGGYWGGEGGGNDNESDGSSTTTTSEGCSFHPGVPGVSGGLWLLGAAGLIMLRRRRR